MLQQNGVVNPLFKIKPFVDSCKKAPIATLNAIVINSLLTKEFEAFSNVSVFGVHIVNGSFSKRTVFEFIRFHQRFRKAPFSQRSNVNARQKRKSLLRFNMKTEQCERSLILPHFISSDQMGNKGAFITLDKTLKPKFTSYAAVVSVLKMHGFYWVCLKHVSTV